MSTTALMELLQKRKAETGGQKTIKPKAGRNRYRILPGWRGNGDPLFYHDFGQHFIKDAAGQVKAVYICTDRTFGRPCEVCDAVAQAIAMTTDDVTKKRIEESKASGRVLLNVLELEGGNPTVPQILEVPPTVFNGNKGVWAASSACSTSGRTCSIRTPAATSSSRSRAPVRTPATVCRSRAARSRFRLKR